LIVRDLLDRLFRKEKQSTREIATLHFVDGMTLQEVADEVGLSLSGVRKRIRELKARIKIKKEAYNEN
jgi:RNA polymerase sigma-70 factor (ECF subfamily)